MDRRCLVGVVAKWGWRRRRGRATVRRRIGGGVAEDRPMNNGKWRMISVAYDETAAAQADVGALGLLDR